MTVEGDLTPRESRHQATALRVERNAVSLVLEHGFDNVTVDMICEASSISQRTFFNYFKTKEAAVVGAEPPRIDEGKARAFIAADGPDLLAEVLELVTSSAMTDGLDEELLTDRFRLFGQNPQLLVKQMDSMNRITNDLAELIFLRLKRAAGSTGDEEDLHDQAELITHAMLGVLRFVATRWIQADGPARAETLEQASALLRRTLSAPSISAPSI